MNHKANPSVKIFSVLSTVLLLFSLNTNIAFSAGDLAALIATPFACTNWNLATDFRVSPDQENPNRDACNDLDTWQFMVSSGLTRDPQTYSLASHFTPNLIGGAGWNAWTGNSDLSWPFVSYNASGTTLFGQIQPDTIYVHLSTIN